MIEINQKFDIALDKKVEKISIKVKNHFPYYMEKNFPLEMPIPNELF